MWLTVIDAPNGSRELAATGCPSNGKPGDGERSASALLTEFPSQAHSVLDEFSSVPFSAESPPGQSSGQFQNLLHATQIVWINMRKLVCCLRRCQLLRRHKAAESAADSKLRQLLDSVFSIHFQHCAKTARLHHEGYSFGTPTDCVASCRKFVRTLESSSIRCEKQISDSSESSAPLLSI